MVATKRPMAVKEIASPPASANTPQRCCDTAVPRISGSNGSTQGDRIERMPARKARPAVPLAMAQSA